MAIAIPALVLALVWAIGSTFQAMPNKNSAQFETRDGFTLIPIKL
jgi:hypothetical protein